MSACKPDKKIPYTEVAANLDKTLDQADPQREAALAQLSRVRSVKQTAQQRERQRLTQKLGASHPRVQALARKQEANTAFVREVNLDLARTATPGVEDDPNAWLLHGRVMDGARIGQPGLTVFLVDEKGVWVRELGHACTDKRGYFRLSVAAAARSTDKVESGFRKAVYLRVSDRDGKVLHTDKPALVPRAGQVDYREITLGEAPADCGGPGRESPPPGPVPEPKPPKPAPEPKPPKPAPEPKPPTPAPEPKPPRPVPEPTPPPGPVKDQEPGRPARVGKTTKRKPKA